MNKVFKIQLEVNTPVHIGSGKDISINDYVIKDGKFYKYNINSVIKDLSEEKKKELLDNNFAQSRRLIYDYIINNFDNINFEYTAKVSQKKGKIKGKFTKNLVEDLYKENLKNTIDNRNLNQLAIKSFIGVNGKKYIPGSSIKGAIRTAILSEGLIKNYSEIENNKNIKNDPFKFLIITDTQLFNEGIEISSIDRVSKNNFAEILNTGFKTNFQIKIRENSFEIGNIISCINNFNKKAVEYSINGLKTMNKSLSYKDSKKIEKNNLIIENFEKISILQKNCSKDEFIINLGFGGGKIFKTIPSTNNRLFRPGKNSKISIKSSSVPLTYNLVEKNLMGWVKCKIIN